MKRTSILVALVVSLGLAALDADAAKRFGGGSNLGKQRPAPTATSTPASTPTQAAPASTTPAPAAAPAVAPKPSFMSRWGGLLAGLGIGALLASLFGAQMGPIVGMLLFGLIAVVVIMMLMRFFAGRRAAATPAAASAFERTEPAYNAPSEPREAFSGIGSQVPDEQPSTTGTWSNTTAIRQNDASNVLGGPVEPFLR